MVLVTITLLCLLLALFYVFLSWNYDYWRKRRVPGPAPSLFTGNYPNIYTLKKHSIYDLNDIYNKYKQRYDAVGIYMGRTPQLLVLSPELAHRVFVTDFKYFHDNEIATMVDEKSDFIFANNIFAMAGDKWKQRRTDITPGLTSSRIKTVYPVTNQVCKQLSEYIRKQMRMGSAQGLNAKDLSLAFTTETVTDCALGLSAQSLTDHPTPIMEQAKNIFDQSWAFVINFGLLSIFPSLKRYKKVRFIPQHVEQFFVNLMQSAIDARKSEQSQQVQRVDFLDYILQLANKKQLNTRQLTAYSMTFLLDGFETTATVLSSTLLLLGRHPEIQQKLRQELQAQLNAQGCIDFDKLAELPYLDACVQESMRLITPLAFSNKICTQTIELPNRQGGNITIEKGTIVVVPHDCYMKDEDNFANPHLYQPERFMEPDAAKKYRERGVFMGFGDGPRICIGMRFALIQIKAALVEIVSNFDISVNAKTRKDNLYDPAGVVTKLDGGIWLEFAERKN
ncbi:Cyp28a5 [Drosophila busckii]|uniref:Cyp28a5 n=1 Tax=Drosophila busckii TaxID=30019 RepID=A0A0M4ENI7_DROBS|nr:probable cytochrome P450 28a5 [Drosophila busckii]ALC45485.1 Cyp28a5 [Drosophila busckii]